MLSRLPSRAFLGLVLLASPAILASAAHAAPPTIVIPSSDDQSTTASPSAVRPFGFLDNIERSNALLGDLWGLRPLLGRYGMTLQIQETSEVLGNVTGGRSRAAAYEGLTTALLQLDTDRAFGWHGGTFNVSALQVHGRNFSADNLLTLQTASGIEADRATRLWELWYQQKFGADDAFDVKVGQQSLDQEFIVSQNALLFVNTMFGWPLVPSVDLPGGGPAYPLSSVGIRGRVRFADNWTALLGGFSGNPAPSTIGDPQQRNASGTSFPFNHGALIFGELQYAYPGPGTMLFADQPEPLPRVYKLGFWYHTAKFDDQRYDNTGLSLADPASTGVPASHRGNFSLYAVADQIVWQDPKELDRTISVFARVMGTPQTSRNLVSFSLNAGVTVKEPFLGRDDDTAGIGLGYAKVSPRAAGLDRDTANFTGAFTPIRGSETFVEVTYQYQATPWLQFQPDFQYTFHPGGGIANPNNPNQRVHNEAVFGLRSNIQF